MKKNFENNPHKIVRKDRLTLEEEILYFAEGMQRLSNYYIQLDVIEKLLMTGQIIPTPYADYYLYKGENQNDNNQKEKLNSLNFNL